MQIKFIGGGLLILIALITIQTFQVQTDDQLTHQSTSTNPINLHIKTENSTDTKPDPILKQEHSVTITPKNAADKCKISENNSSSVDIKTGSVSNSSKSNTKCNISLTNPDDSSSSNTSVNITENNQQSSSSGNSTSNSGNASNNNQSNIEYNVN